MTSQLLRERGCPSVRIIIEKNLLGPGTFLLMNTVAMVECMQIALLRLFISDDDFNYDCDIQDVSTRIYRKQLAILHVRLQIFVVTCTFVVASSLFRLPSFSKDDARLWRFQLPSCFVEHVFEQRRGSQPLSDRWHGIYVAPSFPVASSPIISSTLSCLCSTSSVCALMLSSWR